MATATASFDVMVHNMKYVSRTDTTGVNHKHEVSKHERREMWIARRLAMARDHETPIGQQITSLAKAYAEATAVTQGGGNVDGQPATTVRSKGRL